MDEPCFKELHLNIDPGKFHLLKFILEGYDNLAVLSSVDGRSGAIRLRYPQESEPSVFALLSDLSGKLRSC